MPAKIDERTAGRLESAAPRALALLGAAALGPQAGGAAESAGAGRGVGNADAALIAARIRHHSSLDAAAAKSVANELVSRASVALSRLAQGDSASALTQDETFALESVLQVRGRPAVRVLGGGLEALDRHPGSEFWQEFIAQYEARIVAAAAVTGAAIVIAPGSSRAPWTQGSAWLVARDRVVTNRHVLLSTELGIALVERAAGGEMRLRSSYRMAIEFAGDDRTPGTSIRRQVTAVHYLAGLTDPVDIAVLAIEPLDGLVPLKLGGSAGAAPNNLFVVGHPGLLQDVPDKVKAVFGNPDARKRVSFGKRLPAAVRSSDFAHDASTIGGYSGGPVLGISDDVVAGLHYYGDPAAGNLAITAGALRAHPAHAHMSAQT